VNIERRVQPLCLVLHMERLAVCDAANSMIVFPLLGMWSSKELETSDSFALWHRGAK
jgi:hypothetical protein